MTNQRQNKRIDVNLQVTVNTDLKNLPSYPILGRLENLSVDGTRISFPFAEEILNSDRVNITLKLPQPFRAIRSQGQIQWKQWDSALQRTTCGIKMAHLTQEHTQALHEIIHEVKRNEIQAQ